MNTITKLLNIVRDRYLLRRISALIVGRSGLGKLLRIKIKIQDDYYIFFHPTGICSAFWRNPNAYNEDYEFIRTYLKEGDMYIDIGANVGVTVIPAAKSIGDSGRVIAFEPHPLICAYLQENIELNHLTNVKIHNCALGDTSGYINFTNKLNDETNRVISSDKNSIEVPITLLDNIENISDDIALLKLDVEGYEKYTIAGAKSTLNKVKCIYFEASRENFNNFGYSTSDVLVSLELIGFSLFKRNEGKEELLPIDCTYIPSPGYENLIGIKDIQDFENRTQWRVCSK